MDLRKLKSLIDLVADSDISELEISEGDDRVRIVKAKSIEKNQVKNINTTSDLSLDETDAEGNSNEFDNQNQKTIISPMVGTFYRAPSPDSKPFVEEGQIIESGQTLCVIEAMKLMNEVPSNMSGKILEILVENGEPVEFEQPLFKIEI
ncbi:MAG: acetyl-CoA carboxylase, biotin carboxyl carrier protein [Betaproteobacteria bacterium TMED41]|nr:MAG: acetyl-CoA carboxylase, biotin carboxyl carrier protein [Betaproteobacteria bacterium TMED41]